MHRLRVLSALVLLLPFLAIVEFGSPLQFNLLVSLTILLCAWEFAWLCPVGGDLGMATTTVVASLCWQWILIHGAAPVVIVPLVLVGALSRALAHPGEVRTSVLRAAWTLLGMAYAGGLISYGSLLGNAPGGRPLVYFLACTVWAGDTGAYYVGSRLGRRALAPRVSPKKTLEGALGGVATAMLVAALGSVWVWPRISPATAVWCGALLAVVGILGDLAESVVKRAAGVKDSGRLIPGHGGVLDRLDSLIFGVPTLYALVWAGWV